MKTAEEFLSATTSAYGNDAVPAAAHQWQTTKGFSIFSPAGTRSRYAPPSA